MSWQTAGKRRKTITALIDHRMASKIASFNDREENAAPEQKAVGIVQKYR
jgi:hypothetical protein